MLTSPEDHREALAAGKVFARGEFERSCASLPLPLLESRVAGIIHAYCELLCAYGLDRSVAGMLAASTATVRAETEQLRARPALVASQGRVLLAPARRDEAVGLLFRAGFNTVEIAALIGRTEADVVLMLHDGRGPA